MRVILRSEVLRAKITSTIKRVDIFSLFSYFSVPKLIKNLNVERKRKVLIEWTIRGEYRGAEKQRPQGPRGGTGGERYLAVTISK